MGYPVTENRMVEGGDRWIIGAGGTLEFEAGATIAGLMSGDITLASDAQAKAETASDKGLSPANLLQGGETPPEGTLEAMFAQHYQIAPDAVSAVAVHAAVTLADGAPTTVTTAITDPDVPRTLTVKGNAAGIAGDVVITGTNFKGETITDTIALNGAAEVEGAKAFKTVTQFVLPARNAPGDTVSVGFAKKFGLPHIMANAALLLVKLFNGSADTGSLAVDDDEIEKNLFSLNGTPNGTKLLDLYYLV